MTQHTPGASLHVRSIWTVDLAHLLRRFGLDVCFFTITLGPNPAYANEGFYMENMQVREGLAHFAKTWYHSVMIAAGTASVVQACVGNSLKLGPPA